MTTKKQEDQNLKNIKSQDIGLLFVKALLVWNKVENTRQMPWKGEKNPYKIWLSEIILQQTRVEQGLKYFEKFTKAFPDIHALGRASPEKVFKLWEGLGYYARCKNLIATARYISKDLKGIFPKDFDSIIELKGVGRYTASAIASFAYNLPFAVLDGNVFRVLSRIFDIETAIDSTKGKKEFSELAQTILLKNKAAEYNQAIMDFGAVICKPLPECRICFFKDYCRAYLTGKQDLLPIKEKKLSIKEGWFNYLVLKHENHVLIHQRTDKDIWQQLFEFLLIETNQSYSTKMIFKLFETQYAISEYQLVHKLQNNQRLTHQTIHFNFLELKLNKKEIIPGFFWVKNSKLNQFALPKTLQQFTSAQLNDTNLLAGNKFD